MVSATSSSALLVQRLHNGHSLEGGSQLLHGNLISRGECLTGRARVGGCLHTQKGR